MLGPVTWRCSQTQSWSRNGGDLSWRRISAEHSAAGRVGEDGRGSKRVGEGHRRLGRLGKVQREPRNVAGMGGLEVSKGLGRSEVEKRGNCRGIGWVGQGGAGVGTRQANIRREEGRFWDPKVRVPKMAQPDFPNLVWGGGSRGGGPPMVVGLSNGRLYPGRRLQALLQSHTLRI